jgi:hypothetical protein
MNRRVHHAPKKKEKQGEQERRKSRTDCIFGALCYDTEQHPEDVNIFVQHNENMCSECTRVREHKNVNVTCMLALPLLPEYVLQSISSII